MMSMYIEYILHEKEETKPFLDEKRKSLLKHLQLILLKEGNEGLCCGFLEDRREKFPDMALFTPRNTIVIDKGYVTKVRTTDKDLNEGPYGYCAKESEFKFYGYSCLFFRGGKCHYNRYEGIWNRRLIKKWGRKIN